MNCSAVRLTGFTLLEILIIISIIGIIVLIGIPSFRVFQPGLQLSGAVQNLVADLRYAQQLTISEQITHGIRFSLDENKYYVLKHEAA